MTEVAVKLILIVPRYMKSASAKHFFRQVGAIITRWNDRMVSFVVMLISIIDHCLILIGPCPDVISLIVLVRESAILEIFERIKFVSSKVAILTLPKIGRASCRERG